MTSAPNPSSTSSNEYQPRTPERLVELLRSFGYGPRSWQSEAADMIERMRGAAQPSPQPRWRHKKRGTTYVEIGRANLQIATDPVEEDDRVVIYRSETDGRLWVRGEAEFEDGRFEALAIPSTEGNSRG